MQGSDGAPHAGKPWGRGGTQDTKQVLRTPRHASETQVHGAEGSQSGLAMVGQQLTQAPCLGKVVTACR